MAQLIRGGLALVICAALHVSAHAQTEDEPAPRISASRKAREGRQRARRAQLESAVAPGRNGDAHAMPALLELLRTDKDAEVRARAAWSLGELGAPQAVTPIARALREDKSRRVRRASALALGRLDTPEARRALLAALEDPDERIAAAAVEGLSRSGSTGAREYVERATRDSRPLVSSTAKHALVQMGGAPTLPAPSPAVVPLAVCDDGNAPPGCFYQREKSAGNADAFVVLGGTILGGFTGAFLPDAVRPERRGTRFTLTSSKEASNEAQPLERALMAGLGTAVGASMSVLWALVDDVSPTRAGMVATYAMEGMALGVAGSLATNGKRNQTLGTSLALGALGAVAGGLLTHVPHDYSTGDVTWVVANGVMAFCVGSLLTLIVLPSGVGRLRGTEGYVSDVADIFSLQNSIYRLPFGPVGRVQLSVAAGLVSGILASTTTSLFVPLYEVGVARALRTAGAAVLAGALIFLPLALIPFQPPSPLPTTERAGAGLALIGGGVVGAAVFALSPNDDGMGPLLNVEGPWNRKRGKTADIKARKNTITLGMPSVGLTPPMPQLGSNPAQAAGLYVGLLNGRF